MSNELITLENLSAPEVFKQDKVTEILNYVEQRIKEFLPDETTPAGLEAIDEFAWKITKSKTPLKKMGEDYAKYLKEEPKKVDVERKRIVDTLEAWAKQVRKPVTDREDAEKARKEGHEAALVTINSYTQFQTVPTTPEIESRISGLRDFCASRDWQEYMARATPEYTRVSQALTVLLDSSKKKDADHAELERLRKEEEERKRIERERAIQVAATQEAENKAIREAEEVARQTAANLKAEQDRVAASERALVDAENKRISDLKEAERKAEAALQKQKDDAIAAQKAIEEETARRAADIEHRDKINHAIILGIVDIDRPELTTEVAKLILEAIAGGKIPNVSIQY